MMEADTSRAIVLVCITCRGAADAAGVADAATGTVDATGVVAAADDTAPRDLPGRLLADAADRAATGSPNILVQRVRCLANCARGPSAAIRCEKSWTYVFGHLSPEVDGPVLIAGAKLLAQSTQGIMPWNGRPEALKRGLIARIPPMDFLEEVS